MNKDSQIEPRWANKLSEILWKHTENVQKRVMEAVEHKSEIQVLQIADVHKELSTLLNTEIEIEQDKEFLDMVEIICINSLKNAAKMFDLPVYEINQVLLEIDKRKPKSEKDSK